MPKSKRSTGKGGKTAQKSDVLKRDAEAMSLLKASGVLNSHVTLDKLMGLSEQMGLEGVAQDGTVFIFRGFVFSPCV
jgi:hypothetical protein